MEWRFYGPVIMAVILFLLVGTIFERRIEAAIRRIIEHQQVLLEARREEANQPVTDADSSPASTSASQKTFESKKLNATKSLISSATFQSLPISLSKRLECKSSTFITDSSLERKSKAFIKPLPEITI